MFSFANVLNRASTACDQINDILWRTSQRVRSMIDNSIILTCKCWSKYRFGIIITSHTSRFTTRFNKIIIVFQEERRRNRATINRDRRRRQNRWRIRIHNRRTTGILTGWKLLIFCNWCNKKYNQTKTRQLYMGRKPWRNKGFFV